VTVNSGAYNFGARFRKLPSTATAALLLEFYVQGGPGGTGGTVAFPQVSSTTIGTQWTILSGQMTNIPAGASVEVLLHVTKTDSGSDPLDLEMDNVYFAPAPSLGWLCDGTTCT
jgi:hypothetical protein